MSNPNASKIPSNLRRTQNNLLRRSDKSQAFESETDQKIFNMASNEEQTGPRPEDVEETQPQILETHDVTSLIHEMKVNGYLLVKRKVRKQTTNVPKASDDTPKMTIIIHSRSIDDHRYDVQRWYDVQETHTEGMDEPDRVLETFNVELFYDAQESLNEVMDDPGQLIETRMTQEEVEMFEEDWNKLWNPQTQPILTENL